MPKFFVLITTNNIDDAKIIEKAVLKFSQEYIPKWNPEIVYLLATSELKISGLPNRAIQDLLTAYLNGIEYVLDNHSIVRV